MSAAAQKPADANPVQIIDIFRERCQARAILVDAAAIDFHTAVDGLQEAAVASGLVDEIGQDAVQKIMADAFAILPHIIIPNENNDCSVPEKNAPHGAARSTLRAAACRWTILGHAAEVHRPNERGKILNVLLGATELLGPQQIADRTRMKADYVRYLLGQMAGCGEVMKASRGRYYHP